MAGRCERTALVHLDGVRLDGLELLHDNACLSEISQDLDHVLCLVLEELWVGELPSDDSGLLLNLCLSSLELIKPFLKHLNTSFNVLNGVVSLSLEDGSDVNPVSHLLADLS